MSDLVDIKTVVILIIIVILIASRISAQFHIMTLKEHCASLKKVNDNLTKTFPDIKVLVQACNKTEKQQDEPAEPTGLQIYKAIRVDGAPDIGLGNMSEIIIAARKRDSAMKLLKEVKQFVDDGWWILEDIREEKVLHIKYLREL